KDAKPPEPASTQARLSEVAEAWDRTKDTPSIAALELFISKYNDTYYAGLARLRVDELKKQQVAAAAPPKTLAPVAITPNRPAAEKAFADGNKYAHMGDDTRALADYDEAIRLDPKLAGGFWGRGTVFARKGDDTRAIADFDEAIRLNPNLTGAFFD